MCRIQLAKHDGVGVPAPDLELGTRAAGDQQAHEFAFTPELPRLIASHGPILARLAFETSALSPEP